LLARPDERDSSLVQRPDSRLDRFEAHDLGRQVVHRFEPVGHCGHLNIAQVGDLCDGAAGLLLGAGFRLPTRVGLKNRGQQLIDANERGNPVQALLQPIALQLERFAA
jgi:hypothetical protein